MPVAPGVPRSPTRRVQRQQRCVQFPHTRITSYDTWNRSWLSSGRIQVFYCLFYESQCSYHVNFSKRNNTQTKNVPSFKRSGIGPLRRAFLVFFCRQRPLCASTLALDFALFGRNENGLRSKRRIRVKNKSQEAKNESKMKRKRVNGRGGAPALLR